MDSSFLEAARRAFIEQSAYLDDRSRFEARILKRLKTAGVSLVDEELALSLGLLFRVLAPMRDRDYMRACASGIEAMGHEEAAYGLGMAMHRKNPRRVLKALRTLLTDPRRSE